MLARSLAVAGYGAIAMVAAALIVGGSVASASAAPGDDGTPPTRTLDVGSSGIQFLQAIAVSPSGQLYTDIDSSSGILVYAAGASGTDAPVNSIEGIDTQLSFPYALAFDAAGNLWVANRVSVLEFAAGATGDAVPIRVLTGGVAGFQDVEGIAIGSTGLIYTSDYAAGTVDVFAATATGSDDPIQQIVGASTTMVAPDGITVDATGTMYVSDFGAQSIDVFAPTATGDVAPLRSIVGGSTGLALPYYAALDASGNIYAANYGASTVTVYANGADGDATPLRTITGAATQTNGPFPIAISGSELYVGNYSTHVIAVFNTVTLATGVSPSSGATSGGTTITVTGSGFTIATPSVTVGGVSVTQITVVNDTTLTAVGGGGHAGAAEVGGSVSGEVPKTLAAAFTYVPPTLAATGVHAGPAGSAGAGLLGVGLALLVARRLTSRKASPLA